MTIATLNRRLVKLEKFTKAEWEELCRLYVSHPETTPPWSMEDNSATES
jgi:hypothetical protein